MFTFCEITNFQHRDSKHQFLHHPLDHVLQLLHHHHLHLEEGQPGAAGVQRLWSVLQGAPEEEASRMGEGGYIKEEREEEEQGREQDECGKRVKRMFCSAGTTLWPWPTLETTTVLICFVDLGFLKVDKIFRAMLFLNSANQLLTNKLYSTML